MALPTISFTGLKKFSCDSGEKFSALDLPASITVHSEKTPFSAMMQGLAIHPAAMRGCSQEQRFSG
jgi:hypothetical protein